MKIINWIFKLENRINYSLIYNFSTIWYKLYMYCPNVYVFERRGMYIVSEFCLDFAMKFVSFLNCFKSTFKTLWFQYTILLGLKSKILYKQEFFFELSKKPREFKPHKLYKEIMSQIFCILYFFHMHTLFLRHIN